MKPQRDIQKKRKQTPTSGDEPESKMNKTDSAESEATQGTVFVDCVLFSKDLITWQIFWCLSWSYVCAPCS